MAHDLTAPFRAANIYYCKQLFNHALCLKGIQKTDENFPFYELVTTWGGVKDDTQIVNVQWILFMIDIFNILGGRYSDPIYVNDSPIFFKENRQAANKQYVDYCIDNYLKGRGPLVSRLSGDTWNGGEYIKTYTPDQDCHATISFNYSKTGGGGLGYYARIYVTNPETNEELYLFGDTRGGSRAKWDLKSGANKADILLKKGWEVTCHCFGARAGQGGAVNDTWGVIENLEITIKLKTNEIFINTPMTINTKINYDNVNINFPIEKAGYYRYSFFAYNGSYNDVEYKDDKLVNFHLVRNSGQEVKTLYDYDYVPDEAHEAFVSGTEYMDAGSWFHAGCSKATSGGNYAYKHGVIEMLRIQGTI